MLLKTITKGMVARFGIRPSLISLTYELTWLCNLACSYCDRHTPMKTEMTRDQIFNALQEFYEMGMLKLNLDGGDPLTHKHVDEIVDWLVNKKITVSMNTNGILVPKKIDTVRKCSLIKISLDGLKENHDFMRGVGSFDKALAGAQAAKEVGVDVEFTCTVGQHNCNSIEPLVKLVEKLEIPIIFQPALNSLFQDTPRDGSSWQLDVQSVRAAFAKIEQIKRHSQWIGNGWASLIHFRKFPEDSRPPCAAGWVMATMDPEGVLFPCGQLNRDDRNNNVARLGAQKAFLNLSKEGCSQCWCARLVEGNYAWGMRLDRMIPPFN